MGYYLAADLLTGTWERTRPLDVPDSEPVSETLAWGETVVTDPVGFPAWRSALVLTLTSTEAFTAALYGTLDGSTWSLIESVSATALGVGAYTISKTWTDVRAEVVKLSLTTVSVTAVTITGQIGAVR